MAVPFVLLIFPNYLLFLRPINLNALSNKNMFNTNSMKPFLKTVLRVFRNPVPEDELVHQLFMYNILLSC